MLLLALAACVSLAVVLVAQAGAYTRYVNSFSGKGSGAGSVQLPGGIAVSPDDESVYVADTGNNRISEFTPDGTFVRAWGFGVRNGENKLQTCTETSGCLTGAPGRQAGQLNEPIGVAVAEDGTVYVVNRARFDGRVLAFDPKAAAVAYTGTVASGYGNGKSKFTYPLPYFNDIAVGPNGRVYVADETEAGRRVVSFDPTKTDSSKAFTLPEINPITALAIDPETGRIWISERYGKLGLYEPDGTEIFTEQTSSFSGMAVDPDSGNLVAEAGSPSKLGEAELFEYDEEGTKLTVSKVGGFAETYDEPYTYGLAINPTFQYGEKGASAENEPGVIYLADRYNGNVKIAAEARPREPQIQEALASSVGSDGATLSGFVNPEGLQTRAYFEYGTSAAYGATSPAAPGVVVGEDFQPHSVSARLSGLQPNTTYHYRLVATNAAGTVRTEDATFTTYPVGGPFGLPDGRAYELATPDNGLQNVGGLFAAPGGDGVAFNSTAGLPGSPSGALETIYVGLRGPGGWTRLAATSPTEAAFNPTAFVTPNLAQSVTATTRGLTPGAPAGENLYLRDLATGAETLMNPGKPAFVGRSGISYNPYGVSADSSRIFFSSGTALTADTPESSTNSLYEFSEGSLRNIGILPGQTTPTTTERISSGAPYLVSADGSRVFFEAEPEAGLANQVYARLDRNRTVQISASRRKVADPEAASQSAIFVGATPDGSVAYFTSSARLTDDAFTGSEGGEEKDRARNLYRYVLATGELTDLTVARGAADEELGAAVTNAVPSSDGGSAYFIARGNLAAGATSGSPNLYRWSAGQGIAFIVTLRQGDVLDPELSFEPQIAQITRMTADGSVFFFTSSTPLDPSFPSTAGAREIYRYTTAGGPIVCVSCSGAEAFQRPAQIDPPAGVSGGSGGNVMSPDGARIVFQTEAALVLSDTNEKLDVYEWSGGAARLISSGAGTSGSNLVDASVSGNDVFFATSDQLVPADQDGYVDVYDARVGGGLAEPGAAPPCEGDTCLPAAQAPPSGATLGSSSQNGPGNVNAKHKKAKHHKKKHHKKHKKKRRKGAKHRQTRSQGHPAVGKRG